MGVHHTPTGTRHAIVAIAAKDKDSPSPAARLRRATAIAVASRKRWGRGPNSRARTDGQHAAEPDAGRKDKAYERLLAAARVNRESLTPREARGLYEAAEALLERHSDSAAERLLGQVGPPAEWSVGVAAAIGPKWRKILVDLWASYSPEKQRAVKADWERAMELGEAQAGKRIGGRTYYHVSAIPASKADLVARAQDIAGLKSGDWNVAKIADDSSSVSLLNYHAFFADGFPVLTRSVAVDLAAKTAKPMSFQGNRPILHRKELLLEPGHPRADEFRALTKRAEALGLYRDSAAIGNEAEWARRCAAAGVQVQGNKLVSESQDTTKPMLVRYEGGGAVMVTRLGGRQFWHSTKGFEKRLTNIVPGSAIPPALWDDLTKVGATKIRGTPREALGEDKGEPAFSIKIGAGFIDVADGGTTTRYRASADDIERARAVEPSAAGLAQARALVARLRESGPAAGGRRRYRWVMAEDARGRRSADQELDLAISDRPEVDDHAKFDHKAVAHHAGTLLATVANHKRRQVVRKNLAPATEPVTKMELRQRLDAVKRRMADASAADARRAEKAALMAKHGPALTALRKKRDALEAMSKDLQAQLDQQRRRYGNTDKATRGRLHNVAVEMKHVKAELHKVLLQVGLTEAEVALDEALAASIDWRPAAALLEAEEDLARLAMIVVIPNAQAVGFPEVGDQNTPAKYTGGVETMPIHITVGYVKVPMDQRAAALRRISGAAMASPPLDLHVAGLHHFDNAEDGRSVAVVNVEGRGLQDLNRRLMGAAAVPGSVPTDKPFHAHATLRYGALGYRWPGVVPDVAFQAREVEIWQQGVRLAVIPLLGGR